MIPSQPGTREMGFRRPRFAAHAFPAIFTIGFLASEAAEHFWVDLRLLGLILGCSDEQYLHQLRLSPVMVMSRLKPVDIKLIVY